MAWGPPDDGTGVNTLQSVLAATYLDVMMAGTSGVDCVLSGGVATGNSNMTYSLTKSAQLSNQVLLGTAAWTATVTTAHATLPRIDLIVLNSSGVGAVRAGTAAALPLPPARTANDVVLYAVYVPAAATVLTATIPGGNLIPLRAERTVGPICLYNATTAITWNTTAAVKTYLSLVIPAGLQVNRTLRVKMGGTYLSNGAAAIWKLDVNYGNNPFEDSTIGATSDTDRGAWSLELNFTDTAAGMYVNGVLSFQTLGVKTPPTVGTAGDLAVTTHVAAPLRGLASAAGSTGATLEVQWTMSASSGTVETVMEFTTVELL